jgi:hypothetical protein
MMVLGESRKVGNPCPNPKCRRPLARRKDSFVWQGAYKDGAYCEPCNALWAITGEEIEPLRLARRPRKHDREDA